MEFNNGTTYRVDPSSQTVGYVTIAAIQPPAPTGQCNSAAIQAAGLDLFDLDFGRIGIMICYDGCFTESSRILALKGAQIIFWPSLQRSYKRDQLELQTRSHAYFNYTAIVRSNYGGPTSHDDENCMVGLSCICAADGTILTSIDGKSGWTAARVDLDRQPQGVRTFGGMVGNLRDMRFDDRCPEQYGLISQTSKSPQAAAKAQNIEV